MFCFLIACYFTPKHPGYQMANLITVFDANFLCFICTFGTNFEKEAVKIKKRKVCITHLNRILSFNYAFL